MKEKDLDFEEDEKEQNNEDNMINTNSQKLNNIIEENLINTDDLLENNLKGEPQIFECELFDKGRINYINLIINEQKRNISIQLKLKSLNSENKEESSEKKEKEEEDYINLKTINQIDIISFMPQEDINEVKLDEIKTFLSTMEDKENSKLLNEKEICSLTYYPNISKSKCNFCKCIFCCDCKCRSAYKERELVIDYFLIKSEYINKIKESLYHISLPKLHELKSKDRKRKILAFINPIGGTGNAVNLWERAKKVLNQAYLDIDTIITRQFKEAYNYVLTLDPLKYDGFITCSGDGIIHEIINAIFHRSEEDKNKFLDHCALCALPAGSGNAISKAISYYSGDENGIEINCYYLCKGIKKKIDVQEMQLKGVEKNVYSVIAFMYGFLADCDLESEFLRCIGFFRTTIMGLVRYIFLRDYIGTFYYLPNTVSDDIINSIPSIEENIDDVSKYGIIKESDQYNIFITNNIKFCSESISSHPLAEMDDGYSEIFMVPQSRGGGRWPLLKCLLNDIDNGAYFTDENKTILKHGYDYKKVKWWRFIPKKSRTDPDDVNLKINFSSLYSIDGERYPIVPIQCRTLNKIINFYSGKE